jgi:hypothetical protein
MGIDPKLVGVYYAQSSLHDDMLITTIRQFTAASLVISLGAMWLFAGLSKLRSPMSLADVRRFMNGPRWLHSLIVRGLPFVEIALGAALLTRRWVREAGLISAAVLMSFTIVLGLEYFRRALADVAPGGDCGCFGKKRREAVAAGTFPAWQNQFGVTADYAAARNVVRPLIFAMIAWTVAFAAR